MPERHVGLTVVSTTITVLCSINIGCSDIKGIGEMEIQRDRVSRQRLSVSGYLSEYCPEKRRFMREGVEQSPAHNLIF